MKITLSFIYNLFKPANKLVENLFHHKVMKDVADTGIENHALIKNDAVEPYFKRSDDLKFNENLPVLLAQHKANALALKLEKEEKEIEPHRNLAFSVADDNSVVYVSSIIAGISESIQNRQTKDNTCLNNNSKDTSHVKEVINEIST